MRRSMQQEDQQYQRVSNVAMAQNTISKATRCRGQFNCKLFLNLRRDSNAALETVKLEIRRE